jgi:hypothetical protein
MNQSTSPLEYLAAFAITFAAGMLSAVVLSVLGRRRSTSPPASRQT